MRGHAHPNRIWLCAAFAEYNGFDSVSTTPMQRLRKFLDEASAPTIIVTAFLGTITVMSLLVALVGGGLVGWWILSSESAAVPATAMAASSEPATRVPVGLPTLQAFVQQTMVAMDAANAIAMPATATPAPVAPTSTAVAMAATVEPPPAPGNPTANILSLLTSDPQFSTLVQAIQSAGLAETLRSGGPFTLFAPTNAAFEQLPEGTLEQLLQNPDALAELLSYHLVPLPLEQSAFATVPALRTVLGPALALRVTATGATVNGAVVATASPATGNGLVHPIDMVLQTPDTGTLIDVLAVDDRFTTFYSWLERADLITVLQGEGPFTVFAPVNDAFLTLPPGTVDFLLLDANTMRTVLLYHMVGGKLMQADLTPQEVLTLAGPGIKISGSAGAQLYGAAQITGTDMLASNGVIHMVNTALIPPAR
ncbi:MAG: fasciclin domain-containing protein [Chloroflexi bacterium]|nr:MAG: fasciclin domain-containing protein [Chloroflexota bacterium]